MINIVHRQNYSGYPIYGYVGIIMLLVGEVLLPTKIEPLWSYFTPWMWWAYILALDSWIWKQKGVSLLKSRPKEFIFMSIISIFWWCVFDFYNLFLENWNYLGAPKNPWIRYPSYALAFATIFPGLFLTHDALKILIGEKLLNTDFKWNPGKKFFKYSILVGSVLMIYPLIFPSIYIFAFVWTGIVFFLEPVNERLGIGCLLPLFRKGKWGEIPIWFATGAWCGLLWEFWNYWAGAKWIYTVPFTETVRYFEMPVLGFLGFLPFAWECYLLYEFTKWTLEKGTKRMVYSFAIYFLVVIVLFSISLGMRDDGNYVVDLKYNKEQLMTDLQSQSPDVRIETAEKIAETWDEELLKELNILLKDPDPEVRMKVNEIYRNYSRKTLLK